MIPAATVTGLPSKTQQPAPLQSAARTAQAEAPEAARSSGGETAAAQVKLDSAKAVTAPEQTAVAPRLRDQETAERTERAPVLKDKPAGPPPSFEESPLERQARVAFDPPELPAVSDTNVEAAPAPEAGVSETAETDVVSTAPSDGLDADPPPTPTEKAEASFTETKTLASLKEPASVDVSR
ncbi:MAG: hypothetical protein AAF718_09600 [Pseudomonadota bacterium]